MHITLVYAVAVAVAVIVCWASCKLFLRDYYERNKLDQLEEVYATINASLGYDGTLLDNYDILAEYCYHVVSDERITIAFRYYDEDGNPAIFDTSLMIDSNQNGNANQTGINHQIPSISSAASLPNANPFPEYGIISAEDGEKDESENQGHGPNRKNPEGMEDIMDLLLFYSGFDTSVIQGHITQLRSEDKYSIFLLDYKNSETARYDLYGMTDCGLPILLRVNQANITSAANAACDFLMRVGLLVIVFGSVVVFLMTRILTRPIEHMSKAADKMAHLNFDVHCPESRTRELDSLAGSLNNMSSRLETTICELKESNNQLQKDIAHKVEIDNMRTEFLSNVSHELKTPIALIQGYAEGLMDNISDDDAESRQFYCDVIVDEAKKMNTMVRKLLTLNQIECGQDMVEFQRFDLVELMQAVINSHEVLGKEKDVTMHFDEKEPIYVWADEYMIEEVATNFISNAFHHVCKSNEIAVSMKKHDNIVRCSVYNTGNPIPEEELDKIWIKFYKVDKARTREYGGSGIGLSIVKAIMDNHNRECGVINHEGGVEFWFELEMAGEESEA